MDTGRLVKKLTAKQRQHQGKPRRRAAPKQPTPPRKPRAVPEAPADIPSVDSNPGIGFLVRLPDEPNPYAPEPDRALVPTYIGWRGRALHIQLALLFETREAAREAAAAFPGAKVRPRNIWDERGSRALGEWLELIEPDPQERDRMCDLGGIASDREWERRMEATLTIPDERAPQDAALERRIVETIRLSEPMVFQFSPELFGDEEAVFEPPASLIPPGLV